MVVIPSTQRQPRQKAMRRGLPLNCDTFLREVDDHRAALHSSSLALVEDASVSANREPPSGYETRHQIVFPYFGLFAYVVGTKRWLVDANATLFISPGWEFFDEHPIEGLGHAALLITPSRTLLDEICGGPGPNKNSVFIDALRPSSLRLRLLTHQMLRVPPALRDGLHADEWIVHALRAAISGPIGRGRRDSEVVDRAKQVLHARGCERLSLDDIAKEVGVTPVYLTQEFTRSEGIPLYRYQIWLRLSRGLLELPHCNDITGLALDLGFSSHAHFSAIFRSSFGVTPSEYRSTIGTREAQAKFIDALQAKQRRIRRAA